MQPVRFSPLDAEHRRRDAKMVGFGGWEMPLAYPLGTLAEHKACRESAAMFDVSHLGTVRVTGPGSFDLLQRTLTNDLNKIAPGRAQYTHLLDEDGSVMDDIIVWWVDRDVFDVMPNASNTDRVVGAVGGVDVTSDRAIIAVQGPAAREITARVSAPASQVGRFRVERLDVLGAACVVAGTGYTGEDGLEIACPAAAAGDVWNALEAAGAVPAGLGARDTLRLEAGLPLHGHELGPGISPLQAGLEWVVAWSKDGFRGRAALEAEKLNGPAHVLRGISVPGRRPAREGSAVNDLEGKQLGTVTSGNFSPTLGHCIALALLDPGAINGQKVVLDVRGSSLEGEIVPTPFVAKKK